MNFEEALKQLDSWCKLSQGELIEISPDNFFSFESFELYNDSQIKSLENSLNYSFPDTYKLFLKFIGKSKLFLSEYRTGSIFFGPDEILHASNFQVWESWEEEKEEFSGRYCIVGAETGLGDFFGFASSIENERNFDIFCHEYPPFEYIEVSNEVNSWRTFDEWIIQLVESFGEERL